MFAALTVYYTNGKEQTIYLETFKAMFVMQDFVDYLKGESVEDFAKVEEDGFVYVLRFAFIMTMNIIVSQDN